MTTGKTIALTRRNFVGKVTSLLFNMLSRFRSLGQGDPLEKERQSTPVFLPGESHRWRSLVGHSPRGRKESDTTERLHFIITADGDCSHEIKRHLLLGRKTMTNLDSILKGKTYPFECSVPMNSKER